MRWSALDLPHVADRIGLLEYRAIPQDELRSNAAVCGNEAGADAGSRHLQTVGSKNQTDLALCREYGIVWRRMIAIGQIALANPDDGPFVAVVIEIKELYRHPARGCLPHNASLGDVPDKVLRPPVTAWIEAGDHLPGFRITPVEAIPTPLIAVTARQR